MIPKMTLHTTGADQLPAGQLAKVAAAVGDSVVTVQAISDEEGSRGVRGGRRWPRIHRHQQPRDIPGGDLNR
jgi:hypothetical protein